MNILQFILSRMFGYMSDDIVAKFVDIHKELVGESISITTARKYLSLSVSDWQSLTQHKQNVLSTLLGYDFKDAIESYLSEMESSLLIS